jgi:hypothetical protein
MARREDVWCVNDMYVCLIRCNSGSVNKTQSSYFGYSSLVRLVHGAFCIHPGVQHDKDASRQASVAWQHSLLVFPCIFDLYPYQFPISRLQSGFYSSILIDHILLSTSTLGGRDRAGD